MNLKKVTQEERPWGQNRVPQAKAETEALCLVDLLMVEAKVST